MPLLALAAAVCLLIGFMTPLVALLVALMAIAFSLTGLSDTFELVVLAAAIGLLGPGAFSIDARMFGRREIRIPVPTGSERQ